jgi:hypothetical protein
MGCGQEGGKERRRRYSPSFILLSVAPKSPALLIEREIGCRGMATVHRARDLKHDRTLTSIRTLTPRPLWSNLAVVKYCG